MDLVVESCPLSNHIGQYKWNQLETPSLAFLAYFYFNYRLLNICVVFDIVFSHDLISFDSLIWSVSFLHFSKLVLNQSHDNSILLHWFILMKGQVSVQADQSLFTAVLWWVHLLPKISLTSLFNSWKFLTKKKKKHTCIESPNIYWSLIWHNSFHFWSWTS